MSNVQVAFVEASVVQLKPNDVVIVKCKEAISNKQCEIIKQQVLEFFPDNKIVILTDKIDLEIVSP